MTQVSCPHRTPWTEIRTCLPKICLPGMDSFALKAVKKQLLKKAPSIFFSCLKTGSQPCLTLDSGARDRQLTLSHQCPSITSFPQVPLWKPRTSFLPTHFPKCVYHSQLDHSVRHARVPDHTLHTILLQIRCSARIINSLAFLLLIGPLLQKSPNCAL
jgi:hypothetical protein